jgi:histidinol-phosphatase (PHP family)
MQDYHIHSDYSTDSEQKLAGICEKAVEQNLSEIAITDHIDIDYPYDLHFGFDFDARSAEMEAVQKKFSSLAIKQGVEIGITPETKKDYVNIINHHPFDFVIASVHVLGGIDPFYPEFFVGKTKEQAYTLYLQAIDDGMRGFNDYDVIGHIGYVSRFFPGEDRQIFFADYADILDSILKRAVQSGKGIEVNTKGIENTGDTLPNESILKRYRELGGEILTLGSDAHRADRVGDAVWETAEKLKQMGFRYYTTFTRRIATQVKL